MSRERTLGKNIAFMTIGNFASKFLSFLLIPLYSSVLTTGEYGTADIISTTITLLSPVLTLQINEAVIRFCLDKSVNRDAVISNGTIIVFIGTVALSLMTPIFQRIETIRPYYVLFLLQYATSAFYTLFSQYTKGIDKVRVFSTAGLINTVFVILSNLVLLLLLRLGIKGYILSFVIGHVIATIYLVVSTKVWQHIHFSSVSKSTLRNMLKYSLPMIPNSISWWITNSSDKYMITFIVGVAANGLYSMAYKIPSLLSTVSGIFMSAWNISAVEDFGTNESRHFYERVYSMLSCLDALLVSALVCVAEFLAHFLYANDFFIAWKYSIVLLMGFMFSSLSSFLGSIYTASKRTVPLFYTSIMGAGLNILLNALLIPKRGVLGAAIATTASYIFVWAIRLVHTKKILVFKACRWHNLFSGLMIIIQIFAMYSDIPGNFYISIGCFFSVCIASRKFIWGTMKMVRKKLLLGR